MTMHTELHNLLDLFRVARQHHRQPADEFGFGYSRQDSHDPTPVTIPDGVELIFLTGRTRKQATR